MKLCSFTTTTLLALTTCVALLQQAAAYDQKKDELNPTTQDDAVDTADFQADWKHKPYPPVKPHHKSQCTQINLVCDKVVIDSINCRPLKAVGFNEGSPVFERWGQCAKEQCTEITKVKNIDLPFPCYRHPTDCAVPPVTIDGLDIAVEDAPSVDVNVTNDDGSNDSDTDSNDEDTVVKDDDSDEDTAGEDDTDNGEDDEDDEDDAEDDTDGDDLDGLNAKLRKRWNKPHPHHKAKPHHRKRPNQIHPKPKKQIHPKPKKQIHPWSGLCHDDGSFCGADLFGCNFITNAVYTCGQKAAKPAFIKVCHGKCSAGVCFGESVLTMEPPRPRTEVFKTATEAPQPRTEVLKTATETPQPRTEVLKTSTEAPQLRTEVLKTTTEAPQPRTEVLKTTTEAPQPRTVPPKTTTTGAPEPTTTTTTITAARIIATATTRPEVTTTTTTSTITTTTIIAPPRTTAAPATTTVAPPIPTAAPPTTTTTVAPPTTTVPATPNNAVVATTTTTAAVPMPTIPIPFNCTVLVDALKATINTAFGLIDGALALIPEPLKTTLAPVISAYQTFKSTIGQLLQDPANLAAITVSSVAQLKSILQTFSGAIANQTGLPAELLTPIFSALDLLAAAAQKLATCAGAAPNCSGLLVLLGYLIKAALPFLQEYITSQGGILALLAGPAITLASTTADKLISGAPDAISSIKTLLDLVNGLAAFLPPEAKLPLDILKAVIDSAVACRAAAT
ncbi:hypothetical protein BGZ67_006656 [Mortierella alpina]|nr:hypothetical protein BGZ67_006656 [Mortierella alpina]